MDLRDLVKTLINGSLDYQHIDHFCGPSGPTGFSDPSKPTYGCDSSESHGDDAYFADGKMFH